jgi:hypothetical protein
VDGNYQLTADIGSSTTSVCITVNFNRKVTLYLNGHTITGYILWNGNASGSHLYGGTINCDDSVAGASPTSGCVKMAVTDTPIGTGNGCSGALVSGTDFEIDHLTINNSNLGSAQLYISWQPSGNTANACMRIHNITTAIPNNDTGHSRIQAIQTDNTQVPVEFSYNSITIPANVVAAQGFACYVSYNPTTHEGCWTHNNYFNQAANTGGGDTDRAILYDAQGKVNRGEGGIIENNTVVVHNNRGVRIRHWGPNAYPVIIRNNDFQTIESSGRFAAIHIGENDITSTNDPNTGCSSSCSIEENAATITGNTFGMSGGRIASLADTYGATFSSNTISGSSGSLGYVDVLQNALGTRSATFTNNSNSFTTAITACAGSSSSCTNNAAGITTTATVCNSGTTGGGGTITNSCSGSVLSTGAKFKGVKIK